MNILQLERKWLILLTVLGATCYIPSWLAIMNGGELGLLSHITWLIGVSCLGILLANLFKHAQPKRYKNE